MLNVQEYLVLREGIKMTTKIQEMKKFILTFSVFFATGLYSFSQFHIGVRGGINTNYVKDAQVTVDNRYQVNIPKDATTGFHFGIVSQLQVSKFFLQPEVVFSSNRNDILVSDLRSGETEQVEIHKFNKLNIPIIVGLKYKSLKFEAGPVGSVLVRSKTELLDEIGLEQNLNALTYGYQVGIGLDLGKLALDLKYEGNLSKFGDGLTFGNTDVSFDQRANQLIFSIGLFIW